MVEEISLRPCIPGTYGPASFGHIMSMYACGYYSYLWSLVYSCDIFSIFKEKGLFNAEEGKHLREKIFCKGASEKASVMLRKYLEREPKMDGFLELIGVKWRVCSTKRRHRDKTRRVYRTQRNLIVHKRKSRRLHVCGSERSHVHHHSIQRQTVHVLRDGARAVKPLRHSHVLVRGQVDVGGHAEGRRKSLHQTLVHLHLLRQRVDELREFVEGQRGGLGGEGGQQDTQLIQGAGDLMIVEVTT